MKRIICTLLIVMLAASLACAPKTAEPSVTAEPAAETQTAAPEETAAAAAEAPAATEAPAETAEPAAETAAKPEKPEPVVYETEITGPDTEGTEEPDVILDRYQDRLTLLDETNAEYSNITYYSTGGYNTYTMPGTYTADGDTIVFTCGEQSLATAVIALHRFSNFAALYQALPLDRCGYLPEELATASPADMDVYYSKEKQAIYGVLGIEITLLTEESQ